MDKDEKRWWFVNTQSRDSKIIFGDRLEVSSEGYTSCSIPYNTREELIVGEGILSEPCRHCGQMVRSGCYNEKTKAILVEKNLCFSCNFWFDIAKTLDEPTRFIIGRTAYKLKPDAAKDACFKGHDGLKFVIKKNNGEMITTHNLWRNGDVPKCFDEVIPDNATFVNNPFLVHLQN